MLHRFGRRGVLVSAAAAVLLPQAVPASAWSIAPDAPPGAEASDAQAPGRGDVRGDVQRWLAALAAAEHAGREGDRPTALGPGDIGPLEDALRENPAFAVDWKRVRAYGALVSIREAAGVGKEHIADERQIDQMLRGLGEGGSPAIIVARAARFLAPQQHPRFIAPFVAMLSADGLEFVLAGAEALADIGPAAAELGGPPLLALLGDPGALNPALWERTRASIRAGDAPERERQWSRFASLEGAAFELAANVVRARVAIGALEADVAAYADQDERKQRAAAWGLLLTINGAHRDDAASRSFFAAPLDAQLRALEFVEQTFIRAPGAFPQSPLSPVLIALGAEGPAEPVRERLRLMLPRMAGATGDAAVIQFVAETLAYEATLRGKPAPRP